MTISWPIEKGLLCGSTLDEGLTRQCPKLRTYDQGKRASGELEGKDSEKQGKT
jgi:hypothetical protein